MATKTKTTTAPPQTSPSGSPFETVFPATTDLNPAGWRGLYDVIEAGDLDDLIKDGDLHLTVFGKANSSNRFLWDPTHQIGIVVPKQSEGQITKATRKAYSAKTVGQVWVEDHSIHELDALTSWELSQAVYAANQLLGM